MAVNNLCNGATLTLGTTGVTYVIKKITVGDWTRDRIEVSSLATEGPKEYIGAALHDHGTVDIEFYFDTEEDLAMPLESGTAFHEYAAAETVTVTFPLGAGEATAANIAGTGFFTSVSFPEFENDVVQMGKVSISWNGLTGPKYTKAVAA